MNACARKIMRSHSSISKMCAFATVNAERKAPSMILTIIESHLSLIVILLTSSFKDVIDDATGSF